MTSKLGTELPRRSVAWFWFAVAASLAVYFAWGASDGTHSWVLSAIFGGIAVLIFAEPKLRKSEQETIQVDEIGVLRVDGTVHEQFNGMTSQRSGSLLPTKIPFERTCSLPS